MNIPKIVFTYWEGSQFSDLHLYTLETICKYNPEIQIIIYTSLQQNDKFITWNTGEHSLQITKCNVFQTVIDTINRDTEKIKLVKIDFENEYNINNSISCIHKADLVRIIKLYEHGGIWFDMDILFIKPLPEFLFNTECDVYLFTYENTIPTGFIASTPQNKLMTFLRNMIPYICKNLTLEQYQILGPWSWKYCYETFCLNEPNIKFLSNELVYPYDWITIGKFFYSNDSSHITENTFGLHWYNGWNGTKNFINTFDKSNIKPENNVCERLLYNFVHKKVKKVELDSKTYQETKPYPHMTQDNFLDETFAKELQKEILEIPETEWDRYENPFEQKYTLRNKYGFTPLLKELFEYLTEDTFVKELSRMVGYDLKLDTTRNFWGVHSYKNGDKLDIHVDAGNHPTLNLKKQITLGIYLSYEWKKEYGCELEIWRGDNCVSNEAKIYEKIASVEPMFNRLVVFTCNDYSWHGNPEPSTGNENSRRIFITISYLSDNTEDMNKRVKAFFVSRPEDAKDEEKDRLRLLRADPEKYKEIYRI
jgi:hypothetical protein